MANLKDIKKRIASVKNTQKITRAMKLVSAAKFNRANQSMRAARPYGQALEELIARLIPSYVRNRSKPSPLLALKTEKKSLFLLISSNRGLCGALNSNLFKTTKKLINEKQNKGIHIAAHSYGKKSQLFIKKIEGIEKFYHEETGVLTTSKAYEDAKILINLFLDKSYDTIYVAYSHFQSAMVQAPVIKRLVPLFAKTDERSSMNTLIEPAATVMFEPLFTQYFANQIYQIFLESSASEHGARMTAMDSATNNASEVIRSLTIDYNRARQAAITKELIEITSGAEAL